MHVCCRYLGLTLERCRPIPCWDWLRCRDCGAGRPTGSSLRPVVLTVQVKLHDLPENLWHPLTLRAVIPIETFARDRLHDRPGGKATTACGIFGHASLVCHRRRGRSPTVPTTHWWSHPSCTRCLAKRVAATVLLNSTLFLDHPQSTRESRTDSRSWPLLRRHSGVNYTRRQRYRFSYWLIGGRHRASRPKAGELCPHTFLAQPFSSELYMFLSGPNFNPSCSMTLHFIFSGGCATHSTFRWRSTNLRKNRSRDRCRISVLPVMLECPKSTHRVRHIPRASVPSSSIDIAEPCSAARCQNEKSAEGRNDKFDRPGTQRRIDMISCPEGSGARNLSYISDRCVFAVEKRAKYRPIQDHRHWTFRGTISSLVCCHARALPTLSRHKVISSMPRCKAPLEARAHKTAEQMQVGRIQLTAEMLLGRRRSKRLVDIRRRNLEGECGAGVVGRH